MNQRRITRVLRIVLLLMCVLSAETNAHADEKINSQTFELNGSALRIPDRPRVAIDAASWRDMQTAPQAEAQKLAAKKLGENWLQKNLQVPKGYGSWTFYYACTADGTRLKFQSDTEHVCPKCNKVYSDERTLAAYRGSLHDQLNKATLDLAWSYAWNRDDRFAADVQRILVQLARDYSSYPDRLDRWGRTGFLAPYGGRRYVQSLDEAVGIIPLAQAYDLTCESPVWTEDNRKLVEREFFRATAKSLLRFQQSNNHQTWYNAGLIAIGSTIGDADLVKQVVTMSNGMLDQLDRNVGSDGLWFEGTMSYHNYALQPMISSVDMTRRLGLNLHEHPKLKLMITGPIHATYPDGSFPVINDADPMSIGAFDWAFEWGWKTYRDPLLARALARDNTEKLRAMLGPDAVASWPMELPSAVLKDAGLVFLRQGSGKDAVCAVIDFGPHGGGHGHYDKLNLMLYAKGREWLLDPGRLTYSHAEYKTWVKTTAAHNTICIDQQDQAAHTGELLWFKTGKDFAAASMQSKFAYPDTTITRTLILTSQFLLDEVTVEPTSGTGPPRQIDLLTHTRSDRISERAGPWENVLNGIIANSKNPGDRNGYQHLTDGLLWETDQRRWKIAKGEAQINLYLVSPATDEIRFTAKGIGYRIDEKTPTLIRRVRAARARFITLYNLSIDAMNRKNSDGWMDEDISSVRAVGDHQMLMTEKDRSQLQFTLHPENDAGVTVIPAPPATMPADSKPAYPVYN